MAIDEAILTAAASDDGKNTVPTLRLYQWSEPTLSLGYFQSFADREQHLPSLSCPCVRRHSGGGAILHDREVTYSLVVPIRDRWSPSADELYRQVHSALVEWFVTLGVTARLSEDGDQSAFLCFQRRSDGDILIDNHKVTGSAQRRHRGAILQHGSLLLERSPYAPELDGLFDLGATRLENDVFQRTLAEKIGVALPFDFSPCSLTDREESLTATINREKFGLDSWTKKR